MIKYNEFHVSTESAQFGMHIQQSAEVCVESKGRYNYWNLDEDIPGTNWEKLPGWLNAIFNSFSSSGEFHDSDFIASCEDKTTKTL